MQVASYWISENSARANARNYAEISENLWYLALFPRFSAGKKNKSFHNCQLGLNLDCYRDAKSGLICQRVVQKRERRQRLTAILRAKTEQNYFALADGEFDERRFARYFFRAQSPAGQ